MRLPEEFTERMQRILGDEYAAFLDSYTAPRRYGLRVNPLKTGAAELAASVPFALDPVPWVKNGFFYDGAAQPARHPYYAAGLYYLQEPSAMTPASILPVEPGDRILDLCAAPGGKATALGAALGGTGLLVANDISASRCRALLKNLELFGIGSMLVTSAVPAKLAPQLPDFFDKILLDAPCSGEGMFRKDEAVIRAWSPEKPAQCAAVQKDLVLLAADMLRPGGTMVYSTCTFAPEENEEVIRHLLAERPGMELVPIEKQDGFAPGLGEDMEGCVRLWPHRIAGEGHFIAMLRKRGGYAAAQEQALYAGSQSGSAVTLNAEGRKGKKRFAGKGGPRGNAKEAGARGENPDMIGSARGFLEKLGAGKETPLGRLLEEGEMAVQGTMVYLRPRSLPVLSGVSTVRAGLLLGESRKGRFEPSQALAMSIPAGTWPDRVELDPEDIRVTKYLKGETLEVDEAELTGAADGWQLVCAGGHALGWGRLVRGLLKNKYLPGWRLPG